MCHVGLFVLTIVTTTVAGIVTSSPNIDPPAPPLSTFLDYLLYIPTSYLGLVAELLSYAARNPALIYEGMTFSATLIAILLAHEMGHYLACRWHGVDSTLPFFIPAPPLFIAGTFGAFIKIRSAVPSRRALFDIGLAGPIAGFLVALPIAIVGILNAQQTVMPSGNEILLNDPPLFRLIGFLFGVRLETNSPNPYYMAAWIGLLVTSLNLMPVGQLDGGHATFCVFGQRLHKLIGRSAFVLVSLLAVMGYYWHGSPSGFLYAVLLGVMLKVQHPSPERTEPLGTGRIIVAILTLFIFGLSFWPFPITVK